MGRSLIFYAIVAIVLVVVATNADEIEGRHAEASMGETLLVVGGALVFLLVARLLVARVSARFDGRD
jgi:hypothetical protein